MKIFPTLHTLGSALLLVLGCSQLSATITYSGQAVPIVAPGDVTPGGVPHDTNAHVFQEMTSFLLPGPVTVDISSPGLYFLTSQFTPAVIPAGTQVETYMIHTDPDSLPVEGFRTYTGGVTFDVNQVIVGVIVTRNNLRASDDDLGAPGTNYSGILRPSTGLEINDPGCSLLCGFDRVGISADLRTINFDLITNFAVDEIRILVATTDIPEPGTAALIGVGLVALIGLRKRFARGR